MRKLKNKHLTGFTIVELLIVIVVIAILAAIATVAYGGVQNRANDAAVQSDLRNLAMKIEEHKANTGEYPSGSPANTLPGGITYRVNRSAYDTTANNLYFCIVTGTPSARFSIAARSKSGNVIAFYNGSFQAYSGAYGTSVSTCPKTGIPTTETGFAYYYGHSFGTSGVWQNWTNG